MKNTIKIVGIIALAAIIGFSMMACGGEEEEDSNPFKGTWTGKDTANDRTVAKFTDLTYTISFPEYSNAPWTGSYTYNENTAILINSDSAKTNYKAVVSGKNMTLSSDAGGFTATLSK